MSTQLTNNAPFLRTSRNFPTDLQALTVEIDRSYVDIANSVNARTIGIFSTLPIITGNSWYLKGGSQRQQSIRQVFKFTSAGNIAHGINFNNISAFVSIYGSFTDGTNWYPLPYVDATAANNQIQVVITPSNIVITAGAGAPPSITSGQIVLEWISQV